jgi:Ulp1 family protease
MVPEEERKKIFVFSTYFYNRLTQRTVYNKQVKKTDDPMKYGTAKSRP